MRPAQLPLGFDEGATGSADFAVSLDLPVSVARLGVFKNGDMDAVPVEFACVVTGSNVVQVTLLDEQTAALGAGRHVYVLDVKSPAVSGTVRLAMGPLVIAPGAMLAFP